MEKQTEFGALSIAIDEADKCLRGVQTHGAVLRGVKRVEVFKGADALKHLLESNRGGRKLLAADARAAMNLLLEQQRIVRVKEDNENYEIVIDPEFNINYKYIWLVERSQLQTVVISLLVLFAMLAVALFPIWPLRLKACTGYLFYVLLGLLVLLFSLTVIRFVLNLGVWMVSGHHFWIFPNLYEDCGILESFRPFYSLSPRTKSEPSPETKSSINAGAKGSINAGEVNLKDRKNS